MYPYRFLDSLGALFSCRSESSNISLVVYTREKGAQGENRGKRTIEDRSSQVDEVRQTRRRLNEFDMGECFTKIGNTMKQRTEEILAKAPEGLKALLGESLQVLMQAVEEIMIGMSDGIKQERIDREMTDKKQDDRLAELEEKVKEVTNITGSLTNSNVRGSLSGRWKRRWRRRTVESRS